MKKQKTVIMLENIKENMLGEKHESLLDENKMLRELLKSALDENKKFCEDLELKQKEVDSYKKMNIEGKEEYGNLRKLYDGAKAERNEYFRMYSELLNENKDLKKSYENFVKAKNAQYLRKRKTSSQKDVDALNLNTDAGRINHGLALLRRRIVADVISQLAVLLYGNIFRTHCRVDAQLS